MLGSQLQQSFKKIQEELKKQAAESGELKELLNDFQESLDEFNQQINLVQQISRTGTWRWDVAENSVFWTEELYNILCVDSNVVPTFESYLQLIQPNDQQEFNNVVQQAIQSREPFEITHRLINHKQKELVLYCKGQAVYKNDQLAFMFGTATDITEENAARVRLKESERHYKLLTENSRELICLHDTDGNFKYVSPSSLLLTGYAPEELLGKDPYLFIHPDDKVRLYEQSHVPIKKGNVDSTVYRFKKNDGSYVWLHTLSQPIFNAKNEVIEIHTSSRDHTIHQIAQERLEEEEKKFRDLLESAPDAMVIVDKSGEIVLVNAQTEKLFGYQRDEILGNKVEILIPSRYGGHHHKHREKYAERPNTRAMGEGRELFGLRKDGTEFQVEISLSPIKTNEGLFISSAIRDITDRVAIQNELKEASIKAQENVQLKQDFLANMSHEIRTPMNAILGFTKFLLKTKLSNEQLSYTKTIDNSVEDLLLIINDILDFSRLEAGKVSLELIPFNVLDKVNQVAQLNRIKAAEKGLQFNFIWDDQVSSIVTGDPLRLGQMLTNLMSNAIKFTFKGEVSLNVSLIENKGDQQKIQFEVSDTGIGIAEESKKIIFDSFRQAQGNTTREYGGTGLGLSIVKNLVELHNGNIQFDSELDKGSSFKIEFWYQKADEVIDKKSLEDIEKSDVEGIKVLLVEDNRANQLITKKICKDWGVVLDIVSNGKEAINKLDASYDLVLMDIQMPIMDGEEATKRIKSEDCKFNNVPIVALTAHAMKEEQDRFLGLGMNVCLFKPFKELELIRIIKMQSRKK
jgi:PAS domain S-box-containing protein